MYIDHYNVEILNIFDPQLQLITINNIINTKLVMKNKLKELILELKKFEVQTVLILDSNKRKQYSIRVLN